MKFKSSIGDGAFVFLLAFAIITLALYMVWVICQVWVPAVVCSAILVLGLVPVYFGTNYVIDKESLKINCGLLCKIVPYNAIISCTDAKSTAPAFCLSKNRICIRYLENDKIKTAYVSPVDRNRFRDVLNQVVKKSTLVTKKPETREEKEVANRVEQIKEELAKEKILSRAEERAIKAKEQEEKELAQARMEKELKKLDDIIEGNTSVNDAVLTPQQELQIEKSQKAEKILLRKARKAQIKHDKDVAKEAKKQQKLSKKQEKIENKDVPKVMSDKALAKKFNKKQVKKVNIR